MKRLGPIPITAIVLTAGLLGLLVYGVIHTGPDDSLDNAVKRGDRPAAPGRTVSLPALDGNGSTSLAQLRGKVVVLNFWASWCEPCQKEAPVLERAQQRLSKDNGTVLGVTYKDDRSESRGFVRKFGVTYPVIRDDKLQLAPKFGTIKLPETFVIDRDGRVVAISRGQVEQKFLERAIDRALSPAPSETAA